MDVLVVVEDRCPGTDEIIPVMFQIDDERLEIHLAHLGHRVQRTINRADDLDEWWRVVQ